MNIVLTGYRCSGKTTVGKILAGNLGRSFVDTDRMAEQRIGDSIKGFVTVNGWGKFREIERKIVAEISFKDNMIISTGGGVVAEPENVKNLRRNGWMVWLHADARTIADRMKKDEHTGNPRPSLTGRGVLVEIEEVLKERNKWYSQSCDHHLNTDDRHPVEVAEAILRKLHSATGEE